MPSSESYTVSEQKSQRTTGPPYLANLCRFTMDKLYQLWLRLYQVGNTSSRKVTEALGWVTIQGFDVDSVATHTEKYQESAGTGGGLHYTVC